MEFIPTGWTEGKVPLLKEEIADGQSLKYSEEDGGFVAYDVSTVYTFRGTCTSAELDAIEAPKVGDAWNLSDSREWNSNTYAAGTTWAYEGDGWEPLAGTIDLSEYQLVANMESSLTDWDTRYPSSAAVTAALALKTGVDMAVPLWDSTVTYSTGSTVIVGQYIYVSLVDDNLGNNPSKDSDSEYWHLVVTSGSARTYVTTIGDGVSTVFAVMHNLATRNVFAVVRESSQPYSRVDSGYSLAYSSENAVGLTFDTAPDEDGYVVQLIAADEGAGSYSGAECDVQVYEFTDSAVWSVTHNTGTMVMVQVYDDTGDQMYADICQDDATVTVTFGEVKSGTMVLVAVPDSESAVSGASDGTEVVLEDGVHVVDFTDAEGSWTIVHNKGRFVFVQVYDDAGDQMYADIVQDAEDMNSVTVNFTSPTTGTLIIL